MNPRKLENREEREARDERTKGRGASERSLAEWLAVKLDVPSDVLEGGLRIHLRGRHSMTVHGCCRILDFTPEEIRLKLKDCILCVQGCRLICTAYLAGAVGVEGSIASLHFEEGEVEA